MALDFGDRTDFEDAERGFIASIDPVTITNAEGRAVFDLVPYQFLNGERPDTVNASLWRQA
jgi:alkyl sulfatase BDS1-like metallo-beta-lactamase superfamily hydrolase